MPGNRDFLLGKHFAKLTGIILLPDPYVIHLYGIRILLTHGDCLCTFDKLHQFWFKLSRHRFNQIIASKIPLKWRQNLAEKFRKQSQRHQQAQLDYQLDVSLETVRLLIKKYKTSLLIHGHTHRPNIHSEGPIKSPYTRIVLGAWHQKAKILYYDSNHHFELKEISIEEGSLP